jgi:hypothetical protein
MNEVDENDVPDVSGGASRRDGCFPTLPGYPTHPAVPYPGPLPAPTEDLK